MCQSKSLLGRHRTVGIVFHVKLEGYSYNSKSNTVIGGNTNVYALVPVREQTYEALQFCFRFSTNSQYLAYNMTLKTSFIKLSRIYMLILEEKWLNDQKYLIILRLSLEKSLFWCE